MDKKFKGIGLLHSDDICQVCWATIFSIQAMGNICPFRFIGAHLSFFMAVLNC